MIGASRMRLCARSHTFFQQLCGRIVHMRMGSSALPLAKMMSNQALHCYLR
jgi:hypothetical protein